MHVNSRIIHPDACSTKHQLHELLINDTRTLTLIALKLVSNFGLALCCLLIAFHTAAANPSTPARITETSAEQRPDTLTGTLDWVPRSDFKRYSDPRLSTVPAYCSGTFLDPNADYAADNTENNTLTAFSNKTIHTPNESSIFSGNVKLNHNQFHLFSETVIYKPLENNIQLPEPVILREPGFMLKGERAFFDLDNGLINFWQAQYVLHEQNIHGSASQLQREGDTTTISQGVYSSCPPADWPIWQLRSSKMKLNASTGWGSAQNVRLELFRMPVLYLPYIQFPIDDRRKTGLLFPSIASGDLGGIDFALPLYLNIADNYDALLIPRYIRRRGTLNQGQFRYLNKLGRGSLTLAMLKEDQQVLNAKTAASATASSIAELDTQREFASWHHYGRYGPNWSSSIIGEYISDEEYFHDFGTDFNTSNQTHLKRSAAITYLNEFWRFNATLTSFQTIDEDIPEADLPYLQLPALTLTGSQALSEYLDFTFTGENIYFVRDINNSAEPNPEGSRLRIEPGLRAAFRSPWGFITPALKLKQLSYWLEGSDSPEDVTVPLFSLDTGLFFERDIKLGTTNYRQTLDPRLFYLYAPSKQQDQLPNFDSSELTFNYNQLFRDNRFSGGDRIADYNQVSLGLSTTVSSHDSGKNLFTAALGQAFFLDKSEVRLLTAEGAPEQSPVSGQLSLQLNSNWLIRSSFSWNSEHNINEENSIAASYQPGNNKLINLEFRSRETLLDGSYNQRDRSRQSKLSFAWPLHPRWKVLGYWHYNIKDQAKLSGDLTIESLVGLEYENCCVQVKLLNHRYLQEQFDVLTPKRQLRIQLQLKGLANLDDQVSDILQRTIPYYERTRW